MIYVMESPALKNVLWKQYIKSIEYLIDSEMEGKGKIEYRASFETFKSNICHRVKDEGEICKLFNRNKLQYIRTNKLKTPIFSASIVIAAAAMKNGSIREKANRSRWTKSMQLFVACMAIGIKFHKTQYCREEQSNKSALLKFEVTYPVIPQKEM